MIGQELDQNETRLNAIMGLDIAPNPIRAKGSSCHDTAPIDIGNGRGGRRRCGIVFVVGSGGGRLLVVLLLDTP